LAISIGDKIRVEYFCDIFGNQTMALIDLRHAFALPTGLINKAIVTTPRTQACEKIKNPSLKFYTRANWAVRNAPLDMNQTVK
jgi:hypothetical protein